MAKITLIWVSRPERPFKVITISKRAFCWAAGGVCALLAVSLVLFLAAQRYAAKGIEKQSENQQLRELLAEREKSFRSQQDRVEQLIQQQDRSIAEKDDSLKGMQERMAAIVEQLKQIRANESKIRRFLGMEDKAAEHVSPNQGGIAYQQYFPSPGEGPADRQSSGLPADLSYPDVQKLTQAVGTGLQEVVNYLQERQLRYDQVPMILPVRGKDAWMSCGFGWRRNPYTGRGREFHAGIDIAGQTGYHILAPADGEVIQAEEDRYLGKTVRIRHNKSLVTVFGHLDSIGVAEGARVKRGDVVGRMGNTGRSTGTHLHYSVIKDGKYMDPLDYIWDRPLSTLAMSGQNDEPF